MKVGISGYVGNKLTGIGRVLVEVLYEMSSINRSDEFILFKNYDFLDYDELSAANSNVTLVDIKVSKNSPIRNILWHQYEFQKLLKSYDCDVAYIPNFSLLLWKRIPTVVTIHDLIEYNVPHKFSRIRMAYRKIIDPLMAKNSSFITTVSNCSKMDIIKYCGVSSDKIQVIPNASNDKLFKKYDKKTISTYVETLGLKYKDYLLFVGTIDYPGKNVKTVLDVFFDMKKKYSLTEKLVIAGKDGYNAKFIHDFVSASPYKEDVLFVGYIPDEILPFLYNGAKLFLYMSLYEGFGLPVLEAMSCGVPPICSNTSCFPEIANGLDICVSPTDSISIELKIIALLRNEDKLSILGEQCYLRSKSFSWKASAQMYYNVFKKVSHV